MGRRVKATDAQIAYALRVAKGNVMAAAQRLDMSYGRLQKRIRDNPTLTALRRGRSRAAKESRANTTGDRLARGHEWTTYKFRQLVYAQPTRLKRVAAVVLWYGVTAACARRWIRRFIPKDKQL